MLALLFVSRHWRKICAFLLTLILIGAWVFLQSVIEERDRLRQDKAVLTVQLQGAVAIQELANRMTEAIGQIKIRSNVNVSRIESAAAPQFVDAGPLPFIAAGVQSFSLHSSGAAGRAGTGVAAGGHVPARESSGAVLPH